MKYENNIRAHQAERVNNLPNLVGTSAKRPEIEESLELLSSRITRAQEAFNALAEGLIPILQLPTPECETCEKYPDYSAPLAQSVSSQTLRVNDLVRKINDIANRLEL